ncbi:hypothetical protein TUMEXPCC7403_11465 [Tumidithrix helvetica PCC 7403]|uniref:hypothetical protein n=1 Tax=Tumidithrix helvetica TaxID=3457545 RepID=UPI003CBDDF0F
MQNSAANTLAVSLCPEEAVCYLARIYTTIVLFDPPAIVRDYQGRILIHSLGFPDEPEVAHLCQRIMGEFGFSEQSFPAYALQGLATVTEVFQYNATSFTADWEEHGYKESYYSHQVEADAKGREIWGVRLDATYFLSEPVYDVIPPIHVESNSFWFPQNTSQLQSFQLALQRDVTLTR